MSKRSRKAKRKKIIRLQKIAKDCMDKAGLKTIPESPIFRENGDKIAGERWKDMWLPDNTGVVKGSGEPQRTKRIY